MTEALEAEPFDGRRYLEEYFRDVDEEYVRLYRFWCGALARLEPGARALELGSGPTLYSTFCLAARCAEVHLADYVPQSFGEVERWMRGEPGRYDWSPHVRLILETEGARPTREAVAEREEAVRRIVTRLLTCDVRRPHPLGGPAGSYDVVTAHYCLEMASSNASEWAQAVAHVVPLVRPGGLLLLSSALELRRLRVFRPGEAPHPAASITVPQAWSALRAAGLREEASTVEVIPAPPRCPYSGTLLVAARRPR